jgi:hypothetical protein
LADPGEIDSGDSPLVCLFEVPTPEDLIEDGEGDVPADERKFVSANCGEKALVAAGAAFGLAITSSNQLGGSDEDCA